MKALLLIVLAVLVCRMVVGRWPWQLFARRRERPEIVEARQVLGLSRRPGRADIIAAHRRAMQSAHPDRGGSAEAVHRIDAARDTLLQQSAHRRALLSDVTEKGSS